jgi:hypothetical protein
MTQDEINELFGKVDQQTGREPIPPADVKEIFSPSEKSEPATIASTAVSPFAGFNKALPHAIGWPVDLVNWGMKKAGAPVSETPFMGSEFIKKAMPPEVEPKNRLERALQAGGEGAAYAIVPQAAIEATAPKILGNVARSPAGITARETLEKVFGVRAPTSSPTNNLAGNFVRGVMPTLESSLVNVGAGAGAEAASELVPERWKSIAGMGGGLAGGIGTQLGVSGAKAIPTMARGLYEYAQPAFGEAAQRAAAAKQYASGLSSRLRTQDILENEPRTLVPESPVSTYELTGDAGAGQMQRQAETANSIPFIQRKGEQAVAREAALEQVAPAGSPMAVPQALRSQLDNLQTYEDSLMQAAQRRVVEGVNTLGGAGTPEQYGAQMRTSLQGAKDASRAAKSSLYNAVDPDNSLNVVTTGVRDAADNIVREMTAPKIEGAPVIKPLEGEPKAVVDLAQNISDVAPFSTLRSLDTRLTEAMRAEHDTNGETNTWRLLSQLKGSVENSINNAAENQAQYEQGQISSGRMPADQGIEARLKQWRDDFLSGKAIDKGAEDLKPNLTQEGADRLNAAKQAHINYVATHKEGPVGEVLAGRPGNYRLNFDASVGQKFFKAGDTGFESGQAFRNAVGDNPAAIQNMSDYIASKMLAETRNPETGMINPDRFQSWMQKHRDAMRAFPEMAQRFTSAESASDAALNVIEASRARVQALQDREVANIMGATDSTTVTNRIGNIFGQANATQQFRDLAQATAGNPEARAGLQRSVADYIRGRFMTTTEAATSEANLLQSANFQKFMRDKRAALGTVLNNEQISGLEAIAADLHRANRSVTGTALAGRSNTAQDITPATQKAKSYLQSIASLGGAAGGLGYLGNMTGGTLGAMIGVSSAAGAAILNSMRSAGLKNMEELKTQAILHPEIALEMLRSIPAEGAPKAVRPLSEKIAKLGITSLRPAAIGNSEDPGLRINGPGNRPTRATGGAVNLMALSKAAKKHVTRSTEDLLNESDDTVARALEVANKHI